MKKLFITLAIAIIAGCTSSQPPERIYKDLTPAQIAELNKKNQQKDDAFLSTSILLMDILKHASEVEIRDVSLHIVRICDYDENEKTLSVFELANLKQSSPRDFKLCMDEILRYVKTPLDRRYNKNREDFYIRTDFLNNYKYLNFDDYINVEE